MAGKTYPTAFDDDEIHNKFDFFRRKLDLLSLNLSKIINIVNYLLVKWPLMTKH